MTKDLVARPSADLARAGMAELPAAIVASGDAGMRRFIEFFTVTICNKNTRQAYAQAVKQFFDWCEHRGVHRLEQMTPVIVAGYIERHKASTPTVKQHLAAIRMLLDCLVTGHVVPHNPATSEDLEDLASALSRSRAKELAHDVAERIRRREGAIQERGL